MNVEVVKMERMTLKDLNRVTVMNFLGYTSSYCPAMCNSCSERVIGRDRCKTYAYAAYALTSIAENILNLVKLHSEIQDVILDTEIDKIETVVRLLRKVSKNGSGVNKKNP